MTPSESEELDEILIGFAAKSAMMGEQFVYGSDNLQKAKSSLLQWRTKSLLSKLPKPPEMSKTLLNISGKKYATGFMTGYSAALQDIKKGLK